MTDCVKCDGPCKFGPVIPVTDEFKPGDRVKVVSYPDESEGIVGKTGIVTAVDRTYVSVELDDKGGRYYSPELFKPYELETIAKEFKEGDRVVVDAYPDGYQQIVGVTGTVTDANKPYIAVKLDKKVRNFGNQALFHPNELRFAERKPWMNDTNCAGLRPPKPTAQTRAEAIMATGPVKMCRRIIELEDRLADSIELEPLREALQGVLPK